MSEFLSLVNPDSLNYFTPNNCFAFLILIYVMTMIFAFISDALTMWK